MASRCANCGVADVALFACSICKQTFYCSKICQTDDWKKTHKASCKELSVQPNDLKAATEVDKLEHKKKVQVGDVNECANCGTQATPLSKCSRCKLTSYCCQACQRQHWSAVGGHKKFCVSANQRSPDPDFPVDAQNEVKCAICQEMLLVLDQTVLPCLHAFHSRCITNLRESGIVQACPICRSSISEEVGTDYIFETEEDNYKSFIPFITNEIENNPE